MEAIDFRVQLKPTAPHEAPCNAKTFLQSERFSHPVPLAAKQRPRSHRSMHHALTHRPTVWDSAPISVRLMCLIYQSERSVVSAAAEDKTSPPLEIIFFLFPSHRLCLYFTVAASRAAGVNCKGERKKKSGIKTAGRE